MKVGELVIQRHDGRVRGSAEILHELPLNACTLVSPTATTTPGYRR